MATNKATVSKDQNQSQNVHWTFWFGVCFFITVIITILSTVWMLSKSMASAEAVPVTSVVISGEMPYTTKADIHQTMENINLGNFFHLDVNEIQQKVALLPWVYSVSVRKQWPNEVKLYVVDQQPIARWNGDFFINVEGKAFQADAARVNHALPEFFGPEGSELTALSNFQSLNRLLAYKQLSIDELVLSERYSWQLLLSDGITLNLGREERVQRVQRFMDVYPQIKENKSENQQVDYVDLRYDTGLAVGWKPVAEKQRV